MKLAIIIGTRPQIIKLAALSKALENRDVTFFTVHTGQHYDPTLSSNLADELHLPPPTYNLNVRSGRWDKQISEGINRLVPILRQEKATHVVVIGDSNPAVVGAEAGGLLRLPVVHCEAGLRNFDHRVQEEKNRIRIDQLSTLHLCSTATNRENVIREIPQSAPLVTGDLLVDVYDQIGHLKIKPSALADRNDAAPLWLFTIHRHENAQDLNMLTEIVKSALAACNGEILWPVHPKLKVFAEDLGQKLPFELSQKLTVLEPLTYQGLNYIKSKAKLVITDSVGLQVESYLYRLPCIAVRDSMEHTELKTCGATEMCSPVSAAGHALVGLIQRAITTDWDIVPAHLFGKPGVAERMVEAIEAIGRDLSRAPSGRLLKAIEP